MMGGLAIVPLIIFGVGAAAGSALTGIATWLFMKKKKK